METSLQFQGATDGGLLTVLLAAVVLVLLATGVWRLVTKQYYQGVLCVAAALGPVGLAPVLLGTAGWRFYRRQVGAVGALGGGLAVAAATIGALVLDGQEGHSTTLRWMLALGLWVALAVGVFYNSVYSYLGTRRMATLMVLRCLAILALLLILFKPALSFTSDNPANKPDLPILVDRSGSMGAIDDPALGERYAQAIAQLNYQRTRIEKTFHPLWGHFAKGYQLAPSLESLAALKPTGPGTEETNIAMALREAAGNPLDHSHLPGILLISDGIHNTPDSVPQAVTEIGIPVFVAGIGSADKAPAGKRNLAIASIVAPLEAVRNNVTTVTVHVQGTSIGQVPIECQLFEEGNDQPISRDNKSLDAATGLATFELKWTPTSAPGAASAPAKGPGGSTALTTSKTELRKLRVAITPQEGESTLDDNEALLHVLVTEPHVRVLYVEGTMRPEYKDLRRALESDPNLQFIGMVQVQPRRFWAQGSIGGVTLRGLPATDSDFALFDVIILGDLDRTYFSNSQLQKLADFVNRGGGLLMLGGHNSFGPGGFGGTKLEEVLPVKMGGRAMPQEFTPFLPQLTAAGEAHPIFEGITNYFFGPGNRRPDPKLPPLPDLTGCVTVMAPNPAASVLAVHPTRRNEAGPLVVLAVQNFGGGRSAAFTADTTWQWDRNERVLALKKDSPYLRFWGQMVRYLANVTTKSRNAGTQVLLRADRQYMQAGGTLALQARVQDDRPDAGEKPVNVQCMIIHEDPKIPNQTVPLTAGADAKLYNATWPIQKPGKYRLKLVVSDPHSPEVPLGTDELPLIVAEHQVELDRLARDQDTLKQIAGDSGRYADITRLPELIDEIVRRWQVIEGQAPQAHDMKLYNFTALFLAFAALLTCEWMLRRNWQLH